MTTERWTDAMLDNLASAVSQLVETTEVTNRVVQATSRDVAQLVTAQQEMKQVAQATSRDVAQLVATQQESSRVLNEAMTRLASTQEGITRLLVSLDDDRPTILRKLNTIESKVDQTLEDR
jgi:ribosomal protein L17